MRAIFGLISLVVVLGIVALLAKKQLTTPVPVVVPAGDMVIPSVNTPEQARNLQQQIKQSVEASMQQARPLPDEK